MHVWSSLFSWGSVRSCVAVWRRAPFRLNIATHSLSSVREQSPKDLFLPGTDWAPQPGLSSAALPISRMGFCESVPSLSVMVTRQPCQEETKQLHFLSFPSGGGLCVPRGGGPDVSSCLTETEWAYPWNFLTWPSLDFREGRTPSQKHWELQHINSPAELNKSVYCMAYCKARCILGTKNEKLEVSFLFLILTWKACFSHMNCALALGSYNRITW